MMYAILHDERYLGKVVSNRFERMEVGNWKVVKTKKSTWIVVEDRHEPLVTKEEFKMAQSSMAEYKGKVQSSTQKYLFSDRLRCGVCGYSVLRNSQRTSAS